MDAVGLAALAAALLDESDEGHWLDRKRLDFLDALSGGYTGRVVLRESSTGRGWRIHETELEPNYATVREAIDAFARQIVAEGNGNG